MRLRGRGALSDTLVPPGAMPPGPHGELDSGWRIYCHADRVLGRGSEPIEVRRLTVRQALAFARADVEYRSWVYERSILYAQHLLTVAVEHLAYDPRRASAVTAVLTDPAIRLLEEVREGGRKAGLPDEARQLAIGVLPDLALTLLGIDEDEARSDKVVDRVG